MKELISPSLSVRDGRLFIGNIDAGTLARTYGTPLYVMDEDRIRENCRTYTEAFREYMPEGSKPFFASKACSFRRMYSIIASEGLGSDVVSPGEIFTAVSADFDMEDTIFHGNAKTDDDILFAMQSRVGYFACDSFEELESLDRIAGSLGRKQKVLLRLAPGIDPHTYEAVSTGKVDSKFGAAVETGQAEELLRCALSMENIEVSGYHIHVGSQVFYEDVFERASAVMMDFIRDMREKTGYTASVLDIGGGIGVRYVEEDPSVSVREKIASVGNIVREKMKEYGITDLRIFMEPGRSIVADAGVTLYTVQSVKRIPGYKNYVAVDGGMSDNPRYALYRSRYTVYAPEKMEESSLMKCSLVGRLCESGDIIASDIMLPEDLKRGDIIAVAVTGAYNYSMASNYNRIARPPIVMLNGGSSYAAVRRETLDDLVRCDL